MMTQEQRLDEEMENLIRWNDPFSGQTLWPMDALSAELVRVALRIKPNTIYRADHEFYLDCECKRAIEACKVKSDTF